MKANALDKAMRRYRVARSSFESMRNTESYVELADKWYIFLHAAKGIYTTLEQGAKANPQAMQWFGGKNRERRGDPLLRYISEARNDDEHGIEESTELVRSSLQLGVARPGSSQILRDQFGNTFANVSAAYHIEGGHPRMKNLPVLQALDGKPVHSIFNPEKVVLKSVRDRSRCEYQPPKFHMGAALKTDGPIEVADLALRYLEGLLSEAESFRVP